MTPYADPVEVALVNNMPDPAFLATERQFRELLAAAADGRPVRLRLTSLPEIGRGRALRGQIDDRYESLDELERRPPNALVVTGSEPRCRDLREEPTWPPLASLLGWAEGATCSVVLSCLAAHGALLATDGLGRRRLPKKLSGVFPQWVDPTHPITRGVGPLSCPHSRLHDVPPAQLESAGYRVLAGSDAVGWTVAVRDGECLRVLLQGHPEYEATTLLREYRRDVRRYLVGEQDAYPDLPTGYLSPAAAARLEAFRRLAEPRRAVHGATGGPTVTGRRIEVAQGGLVDGLPFDVAAADLTATWRPPMVRLLANWLDELVARKAASTRRAG